MLQGLSINGSALMEPRLSCLRESCSLIARQDRFFYLPRGLFDQWCDAVSDDEKLKLYHLLRNGDENGIQAKTEEMVEVVMKQLRYPLE